jgi:hypothetical protein
VEITLKGCVDFFKNKFLKIFTDNQNVERISEVRRSFLMMKYKCLVINLHILPSGGERAIISPTTAPTFLAVS